jgi:hypothetical protein
LGLTTSRQASRGRSAPDCTPSAGDEGVGDGVLRFDLELLEAGLRRDEVMGVPLQGRVRRFGQAFLLDGGLLS